MRTPRSPRYIGMTAWIYGAIVIFQAVSPGFALSFGIVIQIMLYISGLPFDCTNHGREDRHFSRPYDLSTFVLTSFVQTEIVQFLLFRLHILTATALQWINDRDAPYRVLLHLSCEIIADCLVFDGCAQIYYFTCAVRQLLTSSFFLILRFTVQVCEAQSLHLLWVLGMVLLCHYFCISESYPRIVTRWWELILTLRTRDKHDLKLCNVEMMSVYLGGWISLNFVQCCWFSRLASCLSVLCTRVVWCFCIINILHNLQLLQRFSHVLHMYW
jgi:hypothetical protein